MRTSPARNCNPTKSPGFTLIELLIALGIIAFIVGIAVPRLSRNLGSQLKAATRKIVVLNKELHQMARLKNKTYRLVIDFGDKNRKPNFYVESATKKQLLDPPDATPSPKSKRDKKDKDKDEDPFSSDKEILKKPVELPQGVQIEDVENDNTTKPITEGKAYVVFFPEGLVQRTVIHLTNGKSMHWTLVVNPLTGATDIVTENVKLKELNE